MPDSTDPIEPEAEAEGRAFPLGSRAASVVRGLAVDVTPLRVSRDFRLLWFGGLISFTGLQITIAAVFIQVYELTKSPAAVGLVGLVQLVPLILTSIGGGAIVDSVDRRRILLYTQFGFVAASTILLLNASTKRPAIAAIYGAVALSAALSGISSPTRSAMTPNLVPRSQLPSALALQQVMWNTTMIVGPALGGLIIAKAGFAWAYAIDVATYAAGIVAALMMKPMPPQVETTERPSGLRAIGESFQYLRGRRVLQSTFLVDLVAMIFGMPRALFPILAVTQFHRGAAIAGVLFSAIAVGALAAALTAGWVNRIRHQGRAVLYAVAVWGAGITLFGLIGNHLIVGFFLLALAGGADVVSAVFRGTILQSSVPDSLRGRLSGVHILVVTGGPRLGDLEAGLVAQAFGPAFSVVTGGLVCIAGVALIARFVPEFARYHADQR